MTVCWHVDDLKVSHVDPSEVTKFGQWLSRTYGIAVAKHRGKVHDYLGMIFDFTMDGCVIINMTEHIKTILTDFPEEITGIKTTPAAEHLFQVRDEGEAHFLPEEQATAFHHAVAQLLFLSARARRDIQPATAFLTTRVKRPDEDDWGKLKRLLQYLKGTLHMPLILSADSMTMPRWWVDAAFAVHDDCKGHTGAGMSFGRGMAISYSWKQKINTKSSTEAEIVGVDDSQAYILWARYFLQEQGYDMEPSLLYQDNMSAILLETNGRASSSKRTKHIKVKYFYITDKIAQNEIVVEHWGFPGTMSTRSSNTAFISGLPSHQWSTNRGILPPSQSWSRIERCSQYPRTASHRRSVLETMKSASRQMDWQLRWWRNLTWRATPSKGRGRGLLSSGCAVSVGAQECIDPWTPSNGSMGGSVHSSSHFLILISDY